MFLRYNLFTIIWAIVIFLLILMPGEKIPDTDAFFSFDKIAHTVVFCILTFLMIIGFSKQFKYEKLKNTPVKYSVLFCHRTVLGFLLFFVVYCCRRRLQAARVVKTKTEVMMDDEWK